MRRKQKGFRSFKPQRSGTHSTPNLTIKRKRIPGPVGAVTPGTGWLFGKLKSLN